MKNVLCVIHSPVYGGPHNTVLRLAEPLANRGWHLIVLLPEGRGNAVQKLRSGNVDTLQLPLHGLRATVNPARALSGAVGAVADINRIRSVIVTRKVDVVLLVGLVNVQAAIAARRQGLPIVWQLVDTRAPWAARALFMLTVNRLADALMTTGSAKVVEAHPGAASFGNGLFPFFPPVDTTIFRPDDAKRIAGRRRLGVTPEHVLIGNVSNLNPQKGHHTFARAAAELRKMNPQTRFVIIGASYKHHAGYEAKLRRAAVDLGFGLGDDFQILGPDEDYASLGPAFDIFWLTSVARSEGTPTVIEEAMALGLPVISTNVGAVSEIVLDGVTGILVPHLGVRAIVHETATLIDDPVRRTAMGEEARRWAVEHFSVAACLTAHVEAFDFAIAHNSSSEHAPRW